MTDDYTTSAVAAAVEVALRYGLPADDPEVIHERSNVLVRLGSVVARVPGTTRLIRAEPSKWLARDVAVSRFLTERGVCVVSPTSDPPPGPHLAGGLPVTLWHYTAHDREHRFAPREIAESLAEVHAGLRDYPGELPSGNAIAEVHVVLDLFEEAFDGNAPRLLAEAERIAPTLSGGPVQALHGDAHAGNLIATADGPCWLDFEDTTRGPLWWDLAALADHGGADGEAALAAYPDAPGLPELAAYQELPRLFSVCWIHVIAQRFPARLPEARQRLAEYLG
jgi:hypothetical protein